VPKDTARGVGAVLGLFQPRLLAYIALGVFSTADTPTYVAGAAAHLAGLAGGLAAGAAVGQAGFCGLNYVTGLTAYACLYDTSMLASMMHLWATIHDISFPVTDSLTQAGFRRALLALMCVCCALLFAAAAGLTSGGS
jgi:hypothetical protein